MSASGEDCCQCPTPKCENCGLVIKSSATVEPEFEDVDPEELLCQYAEDTNTSFAEVQRACIYICKSHISKISAHTQIQLAEMTEIKATIRCLCQGVEPNNIQPLINFVQVLSVESSHRNKTLVCIAILEKHQEGLERLIQCEECSSSPTTPTHAPVVVFPGFSFIATQYSAASPPGNFPGNSPGVGRWLTDIHANFNRR